MIAHPPSDVAGLSNLSELLAAHVQHQPEHTAIGTSDLQTILTYHDLDVLIRSVLAQFSQLGLERGNVIALVSDNSLEFVLGLLAIVSLGARAAPLNPALNRIELRKRLLQLSPTAVLAPQHLKDSAAAEENPAQSPPVWSMNVEGSGSSCQVRIGNAKNRNPAPGAAAQPHVRIDPDDIALLMFTGGTTGPSKLVPLTHRNITASIANIAFGYGLSPNDVTLLVMPLFHGHGLIAGLLSTLASGGSAYLPTTGAFSAHLFWPDAARLGVTWYTAVPTIHRILLNRAPKEYPGSARVPLRFIRSCSAPLDEELAVATAAAFGAPVISAYGMTETSHQVSSNPLPSNGPNKMSTVGLATGVEIRMIGEDGRDVESGGVGEIWVRGATVTHGYLSNPQANAASFVDGWLRTGDLGSRDEQDYISIRGRLKELINRGGEKIFPGDVDAVLLSHPKVLEAETFGEPDAMYGENIQAAVTLRPGAQATESELQDYCRSHLSSFEVPEHIHIIDRFPRTAKGSIDNRALAARFAAPGGG